MPPAVARPRRRSTLPAGQILALGVIGVLIIGLAFALGMLVGRQWARQTPPVVLAEPRKPTPAARRSATDAAPVQEKLTFYQTLTAPLGATPPPSRVAGSGGSAARLAADDASRPMVNHPAPRPAETARVPEPDPSKPSPVTAGEPAVPVEARQPRGSEWTVQVGVFKSAHQADSIRKQLADGGFDAQIATTPGDDRQTWYRVRVGGFKGRQEAAQMAQRVRTERALPTFVTTK